MSDKNNKTWQFWIDRGGTFTDIVAVSNDGEIKVHKLLSENPGKYDDAAVAGIKQVLEVNQSQPIYPGLITQIKLGTTVATNALLERKGEPTALITNSGFGDILRIGYQNRQNLFAKDIVLPSNLYSCQIELPGRINAQGVEIEPFDENIAYEKLLEIANCGIKSCAVVFMHSYLNSQHEKKCQDIASKAGFDNIAISSDVSPLIKLIFRGDTTVADAYLSPVLNDYIENLAKPLAGSKIFFMQSNGGLVDRQFFSGKDSLLSGPAGGVVGAAQTSEAIGFASIIGFDMGGTSTDVSHYDGKYTFKNENIIAETRIRTPVIDINTVAAGGGSIVTYDSERFKVGPESAGANPGPACYRKGGPLTVTDCNLALGRIRSEFFPKVFGVDGSQSLDKEVVDDLLTKLKAKLNSEKLQFQNDQIAWGFLEIAVEKMAQAIKKITIERGIDVRNHALCSFGGAGGQHACLIAEKLGIKTVIIHPMAGVLSAVGIGLSKLKVVETRSVNRKLSSKELENLDKLFLELTTNSIEKLKQQRSDRNNRDKEQNISSAKYDFECSVEISKRLLLKYDGADTSLEVSLSTIENLKNDFHELHQLRYGFSSREKTILIESIRLETMVPTSSQSNESVNLKTSTHDHKNEQTISKTSAHINEQTISDATESETTNSMSTKPSRAISLFSKGHWHKTKVLKRSEISPNSQIDGPVIVMDDTGTNIVEPGWSVSITHNDCLVLTAHSSKGNRTNNAWENQDHADPVILELFNNKFMAIAEEMGVTLRNTSHSVNIKERLDFSCAVFDKNGRLIANAPHMPVHLGSMGASVQSVIETFKNEMKEGNSYVLNNPYNGGTHLPDITVITPVFIDNYPEPIFFTASRGHHADIGGITPGSMPPNSTHIDEEGILIDPILLVENGKFKEKEIDTLLQQAKYPARNPFQNIQDLKAQVAANNCGVNSLNNLVETYGSNTILTYMEFVRKNAEVSVRKAISKLSDGTFELLLDNQAKIKVAIKVDKESNEAVVDFTGTSEQLKHSNFNAPSSITRAAVLYVFRTLVDEEIPLNDGCLAPINIIIPDNCMLNPSYPSAVVAGNVETSQAIVDTLYGALGILSASQGTMNNFTFGNEKHQYYETICGGSGAGYNHHGTDAIHTHMTNSRLTDPEVLELRYPVILRRFSIRTGSGGDGQFKGGCGVVREIEFRESAKASILSQRRKEKPFGLNGGEPAMVGKNYVIRNSGKIVNLTATDSIEMNEGDRFVIETPGGGGFGPKQEP